MPNAVYRHVAGKIVIALVTLIAVIIFNFFLFRAAGNPMDQYRRLPGMTPQRLAGLKHQLGLDQSTAVQLRIYLRDTAEGNLQTSFSEQRPVWDIIMEALPNTLILVGVSTVLSALIGTWLGIKSVERRGSWADTGITQSSLAFWSMPSFFLGMLLIYVFAIKLNLLPSGRTQTVGSSYTGLQHFWDVAQHAILPIITLTVGYLAQYQLIMRASLTDVMADDFITTARAIGNSPKRVMNRHAVPNALLPLVTLTAMNFGFVISGAFTVEYLFSWEGLGWVGINSINSQDYPVMQGVFLVGSAAVIFANLAADFLYMALDPRVRTV